METQETKVIIAEWCEIKEDFVHPVTREIIE